MKHKVFMTIILCVLVLIGFAAYIAYPLIRAKKLDEKLLREAKPFNLHDATRSRTVLVLGDSTAVGIGAKPEESIAALLSKDFHANIENYAVSGAVASDIDGQAARAQLARYDLIEIQVGGNDIIGFGSLASAAKSFDAALEKLRKKSDHIVVLTSGDIGTAPIFRWPLSSVISYRTRELRDLFMAVCAKHDVVYVDIYAKPDVISTDPGRYHAPDGLHLSAEGYANWYSLVRDAIKVWPEFSE